MNWHTTYYPPGGGTPVVRDTPGFLGLPTVMDVDGKVGPDVCGLMNYSTSTGTVTQSISRLPLTAAFPMDIAGQFLDNTVSAGYLTQGSAAPSNFQTTITVAALAAGGSGSGLTTDTKLSGAGPTFTQTAALSSAAQFSLASTKPPATYHFASSTPGGSGGSGTQLNYTGSSPSTKFAESTTLGSLNLGVAQTPGATSFEYCTSSKGFCSNEPAANSATENGSMHFVANQPVQVDQTSGASGTPCPATAILGDAHLHGSSFYIGHDTTASATAPGHVWVDTAGQSVSGCLATASTIGTLPPNFQAKARNATWEGTGSAPAATAKSGTVSCPPGTAVKGGPATILGIGFTLDPYICYLPPVPATPKISGSLTNGIVNAYEGTALTGVPGVWGPAAPNAPKLTYSWLTCDLNGNNCNAIANTNSLTYTPTHDENVNHNTLVFAVTGMNPDGTQTVQSAPTAVVTLPPPPIDNMPPTISGVDAPGKTLTANPGTWTGSGLKPFQYQWETCTSSDISSCTNVNATNGTGQMYNTDPTLANYYVRVTVSATDSFGQNTMVTSAPVLISALAAVQLSQSSQVPDGPVYASAPNPTTGTSYIGGAFDTVGPQVGRGGQVPGSTSPEPTNYSPSLAAMVSGGSISPDGSSGIINAVVSDGNGGYFLGGSFTSVLGTACPSGLAHIVSAGTLDVTTSYCSASLGGTVKALDYLANGKINSLGSAVTLDALAVGGTFGLVLIDSQGALTSVQSNGTVNAITDDGSSADFFYGGKFTNIGSMPAGNLGAVMISAAPIQGTPMTVTVGAFPGIVTCSTSCTSPAVTTITAAVAGLLGGTPEIYFGGTFDTVYTTDAGYAKVSTSMATRNNAAVISEATPGQQAIGSWSPNPNGPITAISAVTLANTVYLAGNFTTLADGTTSGKVDTGFQGLAEYGIKAGGTPQTSGMASSSSPNTAWKPSVDNGQVLAMNAESGLVKDGGVYLAGSFTSISGNVRHRLAHLAVPSTTNPGPDGWNPDAGHTVRGLVRPASGPVIFAVGDFQVLGGTTQLNAAELNTNGTFTTWAPNPDGPVNALAVNGTTVYLGGSFAHIGTAAQAGLAAVGANGTLLTGANPAANGPVAALTVASGTLYVGGSFTTVGTSGRLNLAAVNSGGMVTTWNPGVTGGTSPTVSAIAVSADGSTAYVGGTFTTVGTNASARKNLASINTGSGAANTWNPNLTGSVSAIALSTDGKTAYVGGNLTSVGSGSVNNLAAIDTGTGAANTGFNPNPNGIVRALAMLGGTVLVGGDFTTIGGTGGPYAAQVDAVTGAATSFAPAPNGSVYSILVNSTTASGNPLVGLFGAFTNIGGNSTDGYGFFGG
jgi:hypothetical protein